MRPSIARLFLLSAIWLAAASAQTPGQPPNGNLEFRILPEAVVRGMPQAFSFLLVNRTDHDVRVPVPAFKCSTAFVGSISLNVRFTPKVPSSGPSSGSGCAGDRMDWPPITERIMEWQVVPSGYALILKVDPKNIVWKIASSVDISSRNAAQEHAVQPGMRSYWYDDSQPGSYEFWATYSPPSISRSDQTKLEELGIDFPRAAGGASQSTDHVTFVRDQ
jgi:hypothetical protein